MCVGKMMPTNLLKPRFVKTKEIRNKKVPKTMELMHETGKLQLQQDALAVSTQYTRIVFEKVDEIYGRFQDSKFYRILVHTTQPAHLVTALSVLLVSFLALPGQNRQSPTNNRSPIWTLVYLGSFALHLGAQIWMTFVSGLALYFSLPRHTFGAIQKVLFPKYFLLNSILSLITLVIFLKNHNQDLAALEVALQAGAMVLCFLTELVIRLYLTPPLLDLITVKTAMEKQAGVGEEIGKITPGSLLACPRYMKIHKQFRKVHMTIAIGNVITVGCTMFHLYYLSHKLCAI